MSLIFLTLFLSSVHADYSISVLDGCEKLTHAMWVSRYQEAELQLIESFEKDPRISVTSDERDLFEVVFPQDLPSSHPMKGAFTSCFGYFETYQKAINNVQSNSARNKLERCYQRAYRQDPPKVLKRYMTCLKKIKY